MSKLLLSSILASGLLLAGGSAYADNANQNKDAVEAQSEQTMDQGTDVETRMPIYISGKITGIDGDTIKIKETDGTEHTVKITGFEELQNLQAETLEVGDSVVVLTKDTKPYAISKVVESWSEDADNPDYNGSESFSGRVVEIDGDTIKIKDKDGVVHTAKVTGFQNMEQLQAESIEKGDIVLVNVRDGKTYGISKQVEAWLID